MTRAEMKTKANAIVSNYLGEDTQIDFDSLSKEEKREIADAIQLYEDHLDEGMFGAKTNEQFEEKVEKDLMKISKIKKKVQKKSAKDPTIKEMVDSIDRVLDDAWQALEEFKRSDKSSRDREKLESAVLEARQDGKRMAKRTKKFIKTERVPILKGFLLLWTVFGLIIFLAVRTRRRKKFFRELSSQRMRQGEMGKGETKKYLVKSANDLTRAVVEDTQVNETVRDIYKYSGLLENY